MVKVLVHENNVESALRKIKRKAQKEGLFLEQRKRQRYTKPSVLRVENKKQAIRNEKKRQRILEKVYGF